MTTIPFSTNPNTNSALMKIRPEAQRLAMFLQKMLTMVIIFNFSKLFLYIFFGFSFFFIVLIYENSYLWLTPNCLEVKLIWTLKAPSYNVKLIYNTKHLSPCFRSCKSFWNVLFMFWKDQENANFSNRNH